MATVNEAKAGLTPMGADLQAGVEAISRNQTVTFTLYVRQILPLDGYAFWINSTFLTEAAITLAMRTNSQYANQQPPPVEDIKRQLTVRGSLHYATDTEQEETSSISVNKVVFTAQDEVQDLNTVNADLVYIATFDGIRFAFSSRGMFYEQANLWHYFGDAIYSTMESQIIDAPGDFDGRQLVVSNSLPAWLAMNSYDPPWPVPMPFPALTLYPSFLVPTNISPPYGTVHIEPESTASFQAAPFWDINYSRDALARERVIVTLYGTNNDTALQFLDCVLQYSYDTDLIGMMNMPVVRDDKLTQTELLILAMKKRIIFDVSYNQSSIRDIARQLIAKCVTSYYPRSDPPIIPPI